ncbi:3-keto-disaccharide hydrolase [Membranihabitans maritimus]|uniref:3-keto-disaccharide hydrolase n=1 Tax=Membranihabitans maritimus TaxID=2904244 RepID=UPI001F4297B8|nr:DUF1080 domain-containing protein [Membranihabitans maritimus]
MKQVLSSPFLLFFALIISFSCQEKPVNQLSTEEQEEGWELLFNGTSLDGWKDYHGEGVSGPWKVENGLLQALGKGSDGNGYLMTEKEYENFVLTFEWKISEGGNSGVLYHVIDRPQYEVPYVSGPEYQVLDDVGFPADLEEWQMAGADYAMHVADKDQKELKPVGQWNTSKIVFDNGHVEHWLNGKKIVEFEAWTEDWFERKESGKWADAPEYGLARKGHFVLQDHGAPTWYRNIKVKELPRETSEEDLFNGEDLTGWEVYGTEKWYVDDGILICESGPDEAYGYLATKKYYNDFDLSVDFLQEADGNSGIFFRSFIEEGTKISGWQVEVAPPGNNSGGIYESYGRGWIFEIPEEKEDILNMGEWNTMRIKVVGGKVTTWLNGEVMTELDDEKIANAQGRIALQIHSGGGIRVRWKNLKMKEL